MDYVLVSNEEGEAYITKAKEWLCNKERHNMWSDYKFCAYSAVAEYLANQDGKTLYSTRIKELPIYKKGKTIRSKKDLKPGDTIMFANGIENWQDKNFRAKNIPKNTNVVFLEMKHLGYNNNRNESLLEFSVLFDDTVLKSIPYTWNKFLEEGPLLIEK